MAEFFDALTDKHIEMMAQQPLFFVATAAAGGRINLSPKGYDTLRVISPATSPISTSRVRETRPTLISPPATKAGAGALP